MILERVAAAAKEVAQRHDAMTAGNRCVFVCVCVCACVCVCVPFSVNARLHAHTCVGKHAAARAARTQGRHLRVPLLARLVTRPPRCSAGYPAALGYRKFALLNRRPAPLSPLCCRPCAQGARQRPGVEFRGD